MDMALPNEHEDHRSISEDVFYPAHPPRSESHTFKATKATGHKLKLPCAISGHTEKTEYHHAAIEWAFSNAVDWHKVKAVALGEIKALPVLDLATDQPTDDTFPVEHSLLFLICKFLEYRGFDWQAFDPDKPETLVDSMANMLVLHEKFHRGKNHGIHEQTLPVFIFQAFPRKDGFVYSPDELLALHKGAV